MRGNNQQSGYVLKGGKHECSVDPAEEGPGGIVLNWWWWLEGDKDLDDAAGDKKDDRYVV
jgi:hypothetical protein